MSSNGYIFYEKEPNVFEGVSVKYEAHLTNLGANLINAYNEQSLVEKLISLGSLSIVDVLSDTPPKYQSLNYIYRENFPPHIFGYSLACHRDYKEPKKANIIAYSLEEIAKNYPRPYVWQNNEWLYLDIETQSWKKAKESLQLIYEFDHKYVRPLTIWNETYSRKDFFEIINYGFLITNDNKFNSGDYINFIVDDDKKTHVKYQLLLQISHNYPHDAIEKNYRLLILSKPPIDLAWYSPILNSLELNT